MLSETQSALQSNLKKNIQCANVQAYKTYETRDSVRRRRQRQCQKKETETVSEEGSEKKALEEEWQKWSAPSPFPRTDLADDLPCQRGVRCVEDLAWDDGFQVGPNHRAQLGVLHTAVHLLAELTCIQKQQIIPENSVHPCTSNIILFLCCVL